ncbi:MAG TPA: dockerin type I domain-containing protein, partial [Gemmataceae bacterium]|nr:dockerin type I domain-containing protein [Gemmataceae bacterium]
VDTATHSIGDGEYGLVLSGVPGLANNTYDFFRLLGDMDGSGTVDTTDFATLVSTYLRSTNDPLYLGADDLDGDGSIGTTDFAQFTSNFLKSVPTPLPN